MFKDIQTKLYVFEAQQKITSSLGVALVLSMAFAGQGLGRLKNGRTECVQVGSQTESHQMISSKTVSWCQGERREDKKGLGVEKRKSEAWSAMIHRLFRNHPSFKTTPKSDTEAVTIGIRTIQNCSQAFFWRRYFAMVLTAGAMGQLVGRLLQQCGLGGQEIGTAISRRPYFEKGGFESVVIICQNVQKCHGCVANVHMLPCTAQDQSIARTICKNPPKKV